MKHLLYCFLYWPEHGSQLREIIFFLIQSFCRIISVFTGIDPEHLHWTCVPMAHVIVNLGNVALLSSLTVIKSSGGSEAKGKKAWAKGLLRHDRSGWILTVEQKSIVRKELLAHKKHWWIIDHYCPGQTCLFLCMLFLLNVYAFLTPQIWFSSTLICPLTLIPCVVFSILLLTV